jgi:hypothetical protein
LVSGALTTCLTTSDCTYSDAKLSYGGGPVLTSPKVYLVQVLNGGSGPTCDPNFPSVAGAFAGSEPNLSGAVSTIVNSAYSSWWSEYSVPGSAVGPGSYGGCVVLNVAAGAVSDGTIQAALKSAVFTSPGFPAYSSQNVYVLLFQPNQVVTYGAMSSVNGFCAYHSATYSSGNRINYDVMPYEAANPGCAEVGSSSALAFDNLTAVLSHELAETVTDPNPISGWSDTAHPAASEMADLCTFAGAGHETAYVASPSASGVSYALQYLFSNQANGCIATPIAPTAPTNLQESVLSSTTTSISWSPPSSDGGSAITGYSVSASPTVTPPASCTNTVNLTCTFTGLNPGVTYSFSVVATNAVGTGPGTTVIPTSPPQAAQATAELNAAQISWTPPSGSSPSSYTATASPGGASCTTSSTSCTITGLAGGVSYQISVVARSSGGLSAPTSTSVTTLLDDSLTVGGVLRTGQSLISQNGQFTAVFQASDGNFVIYGPFGPIWASGTGARGAASLDFQGDGNIVMYNAANQPVWASGSSSKSPSALTLGNDGDLVATNASKQTIWSSQTGAIPEPFFVAPPNAPSTLSVGSRISPGMALVSPNGDYLLVMQSDGNLVLYGPRGPVWSTSSQGLGSFMIFQPGDGNLVLYTQRDVPLWATGSGGRGATFLVLQNDGNFVIYTAQNVPVWASGT